MKIEQPFGKYIFVLILIVISINLLCDSFKKPVFKSLGPQKISIKSYKNQIKGLFNKELGITYLDNQLSIISSTTLESDLHTFGGWSGLSISDNKQLLTSVSDSGTWLKANLNWTSPDDFELKNVQIGLLKANEDRTLRNMGFSDIESLRIYKNKIFLTHESFSSGILIAEDSDDIATGRFRLIDVPSNIKALPKGRGLESIAIIDNGMSYETFVIAERSPNGTASQTPAWLISEKNHKVQELTYPLSDNYNVTDVDYHDECGLFSVERKVTWIGRFYSRIYSIYIDHDKNKVKKKLLFQGDSRSNFIDNMEGISVVKQKSEDCDIFLISDSNFLLFQRNVLLHMKYII